MKKAMIAFAAGGLLAAGCFEDVPPPRVDRVEPTTPARVLTNVAASFNHRDVNLLKAMLSENFVFYFDPRDVGHTIPESISYAEFCNTVNNMFEHAYSLSLTIYVDTVGPPSGSATEFRAEYVKLNFTLMVDERNGFAVNHGYFNFKFERYDAGAKKYWRLTGWWDHTGTYFDERASDAPASFGRILALYF